MGSVGTRIVILGGYGYAGSALAPLLLQETEADLVLAGRNGEKARQAARELNDRFNGGRVTGVRADAGDATTLAAAFDGAGIVVVASSTVGHAATVARSALERGLDYLDIQYSARKLRVLRGMAGAIEQAGRCFITEAGFHPGLPSALVRYAASRFDRLERAITASVLNPQGGLPYSGGADELVESFRHYRPKVYRGGAWRGISFWNPYRRIRFGRGFGTRGCVPLPLEELRGIPEMIPGILDAGFYVAGFNWFADWVVTPIVMTGVWFFPRALTGPMARLLCWSTRFFTGPPYGVVLQLDAEGVRAGARRKMRLILYHEDGYALTAAPVAACLLQVLDGSSRRPGLHMMGHLVEPSRLLADMRSMGVRCETDEGADTN